MNTELRALLYEARCALTGQGGEFLERKKRFHEARFAIESEYLGRVAADPALMENVACPSCGSTFYSDSFVNPVGFRFLRCAKDETVYMCPRPSAEGLHALYNSVEYSMGWTEDGSGDAPVVMLDELAALVRMASIDSTPSESLRLLDVGAATGDFARVAQSVFRVTGVEMNDHTARIARARGLDVVTGSLSSVDASESFDVVTMLQLIEHVPDPAGLLRSASRVLRPGGFVYVSTPAAEGASLAKLRGLHAHVSGFGHIGILSVDGIRRIAERVGLSVLDTEYWGGVDYALHDRLSHLVSPRRFRHRMAGYSPRLYFGCAALTRLIPKRVLALPSGTESYVRVLLQRRE